MAIKAQALAAEFTYDIVPEPEIAILEDLFSKLPQIKSIPLQFIPNPSIEIAKGICQAAAEQTWMNGIIAYLRDGTLPPDKLQARWIQYRATRFCLLHGILYKRSFSGPLLQCLRSEEVEYVLREIHEGVDILGPLPQATLQRKFLNVAIDCFTKWVEAEPLAKITERNTRNLMWKNIVYQFEIPKVIISNNAKQFDNDGFKLILFRPHHLPTFLLASGDRNAELQTSNFNKDNNEIKLRLNLDLLDEKKE
ncbi:hypothetical protein Acr_08g0008380 [Actinidia rufa]|uniref:Integrase catalytic domain-containing protein n=1 Tax=Actinidia rufa TaxID=165716 RepID=A0A7J0F185_9ERIC|nr:hypothetical protein Acr_08g0008380 [Actinidia rufa]